MLSAQFQHIVTPSKDGSIRAVRFNVDGEYCLTCGSDKTLKLWNPFKQILLKTYSGHGQDVLDADSSTDSSKLVSCSADRTVVLWDVETGKLIRKYRGHTSKVNTVKFNQPDCSVIFSASYDCTVRCWDCRTRNTEAIQIIDDAKDSISSLQLSDAEIVTGSVDGYVRTYDIRQGQLKEDCIGEPVTCVNLTGDNQCILTSTLDNCIRLVDKDTGSVLNKFEGHVNKEYKLDSCVSTSDAYVVSGSEDGNIYVWDLVQAKVLRKIEGAHKGAVYSLSRHPTKDILLTVGTDCVKLWSNGEDMDLKVLRYVSK